MKKTVFPALVIVALLISALPQIEFVRNASANPNLRPPEMPSGYTINRDGTYSAQNLQRDGKTYTLTGDINSTIIIDRDGIVLDGAGFTLRGNGDSSGIWVLNRSDIVIKNFNIQNFRVGINFVPYPMTNTVNANCSVLANSITNNTIGISLAASLKNYVAGNYIADTNNGITLHGSDILRNNRFERNQYDVFDAGYGDNDIDTSNTIDGKPIYYLVNQHSMTVPTNAGLVMLKNCTGIKVENLNLEGNEHGLMLINTNNSLISRNIITDNFFGIALRQSSNNTLSDNQVTNNPNSGIELWLSNNNKIIANKIIGNGFGVALDESEFNSVSENQIIANERAGLSAGPDSTIIGNFVSENLGHGIKFSNISGSTVTRNRISLNKGYGIGFEFGPNGMIKGNDITNNSLGIWIGAAFYNTIMSNAIAQNDGFGIKLEGPHHDNLIYHNNFIDNNNKGTQASIAQRWTYPDLHKRLEPGVTPQPPQLVDGDANRWDDGAEGNYWSDYTTRYPDAQAVEDSKVGIVPYYINENNQDNHPLMAPHEISINEVPSTTILPNSSTQPNQENDPTQSSQVAKTNPTTFPTALVITFILSASAVATCLLVYFAKRKVNGMIKQ